MFICCCCCRLFFYSHSVDFSQIVGRLIQAKILVLMEEWIQNDTTSPTETDFFVAVKRICIFTAFVWIPYAKSCIWTRFKYLITLTSPLCNDTCMYKLHLCLRVLDFLFNKLRTHHLKKYFLSRLKKVRLNSEKKNKKIHDYSKMKNMDFFHSKKKKLSDSKWKAC